MRHRQCRQQLPDGRRRGRRGNSRRRRPCHTRSLQKAAADTYPDGLPTGEAVATTAGNLPARYLIHTVGPVYSCCGEQCADLLAAAYRNSLQTAWDLGCRDIVFPAISTGIYSYPKAEAARIAYRTVKKFLETHPMKGTFIFHNNRDREIFEEAVKNA